MQNNIETNIAARAALPALAEAIANALAAAVEALRSPVQWSGTDGSGQIWRGLSEAEGALAIAGQPALAALVRRLRLWLSSTETFAAHADIASDPRSDTRSDTRYAAAVCLQQSVNGALRRIQHHGEVRAADLLPCWRHLAAAGGQSAASAAELLSLQVNPDDLPPLPLAVPCNDPLVAAERALLVCLRADQPQQQADAVRAYAEVIADVIAAAGAEVRTRERVCWMALHAWLLEHAQARTGFSDDDKKILAASVRVLRHRGRAGIAATLEPLAREVLLSLSMMPLHTEVGRQVARLFRLDCQLGKATVDRADDRPDQEAGQRLDDPDALIRHPLPAPFRDAVAEFIAAIDADAARIVDANSWHALADQASLAAATSVLALPLRQAALQSDDGCGEQRRELLAAMLLMLRGGTDEGDATPDQLAALMTMTNSADSASAKQALCACAHAHSAHQRLAALCDTLRAELSAAEQALEAAYQHGDDGPAVTVAANVLRQISGALALCDRLTVSDAVEVLRQQLAAVSTAGDLRRVADHMAADWVRLSAAIAVLPWQPAAASDPVAGAESDAAPLTGQIIEQVIGQAIEPVMAPGITSANAPATASATESDTDAVILHDAAPDRSPREHRESLAAIFIEEAGGHLRSLCQLALLSSAPDDEAAALRAVHTVAGCSSTIGLPSMATLALALEEYLQRAGWRTDDVLITDTLNALQQMLDGFIASGYCSDAPDLLARLQYGAISFTGNGDDTGTPETPSVSCATSLACDDGTAFADAEIVRVEVQQGDVGAIGEQAADATGFSSGVGESRQSDLRWPSIVSEAVTGTDTVQELRAIFDEEAADLLPQLELALRAWTQHPDSSEPPRQVLRLLHTLKGSARMAGRQSIGDEFHHTEAEIIVLAQQPAANMLQALPALQARVDRWMQPDQPAESPSAAADGDDRISDTDRAAPAHSAESAPHATAATLPERPLRVRASQIARVADAAAALWVGNAGIGDAVQDQRQAIAALSDDLARLRLQLRELEIEAESRIVARAAQNGDADFDPLEFDRYTRLHELTRMMAETIDDLAGTQRGLRQQIECLAAAASAQARDLRRFQQDVHVMRTQPLRSIESRLRHVLRLAARDTGREVVLRLEGGQVEIERSLLDRLNGPFGHLLRNAVVHGIEPAEQRVTAGKPASGTVTLGAKVEGNALRLWLQDDGRGLDLAQVRQRAIGAGLLHTDEIPADDKLAELIFAPGFSTATEVTTLSGRGIGMDAVCAEVQSLGGRIAVHSQPGQGCRFTLTIPIALTSMPVLLAVAGTRRIALPAASVRQLLQPQPDHLSDMAGTPQLDWQGSALPLRDLAQLLGEPAAIDVPARSPVVVMQQGERLLAMRLDAVHGQREVIVRHPGAQLARVPGMAGATLLGDGSIALIVDPFGLPDVQPHAAKPTPEPPRVLVVDDSLTVRRASQRLLERHGYTVSLARDGLEALALLERPGERRPCALLLDIEMPRMDGFELLAALRADACLSALPVVMITSRIAERHRERARELGVLGYLGKPFDEQALLALLAGLTGKAQLAA